MIKPSEISFLPNSSGCYLFNDKNSKVLYVGKAKNLKKRVANYFQNKSHPARTQMLVERIAKIDFIVTKNESEALLLENNLIKLHYPKFNIDLKDSRRYAYLKLTKDEFPVLEVARIREKNGEYFGPFTSGRNRKTIMDTVTRKFKILNKKPSPKLKKILNKEEYNQRVKKARFILSGKTEKLLANLEKEMNSASNITNFEYAITLREQINALKTLEEKQVMELNKAIDANLINYQIVGDEVYLLVFNIKKGVVEDKQEFIFDFYEDFFDEFVTRLYDEENTKSENIPSVIIVPKKVDDLISEYLSKKANKKVKIVVPKTGTKKELLNFVTENITATFFAGKERITELKNALKLPKLPKIIECFDISHLSGTNTVASMVTFKDGFSDKKNYRKFRIRSDTHGDDLLAMKEVLTRRYTRVVKDKLQKPDLIVIDGGPTQLSIATTILKELKLVIPIISLAKQFEEVYIPILKNPIRLDQKNKGLQLLIAIRNETHRFGINYQRNLRSREFFRK